MSSHRIRLFIIATTPLAISGCGGSRDAPAPTRAAAVAAPAAVAEFRVPKMNELKDSAMRFSVSRGRAILEATRDSLPHNVGNSLRCVSCHFAAGTAPNAMPWVGVYSRFPQFRPRSGRVDLLEDRINDCFERSLNGRPLKSDSRDMRDIVAYMAFLSLGVPAGSTIRGQGVPKLQKLASDTSRGAVVFTAECSRCHGSAGQGSAIAPPLWGANSYNNGAGMSRIGVLASFAHRLMPLDKPGSLTPQQYYDVSAYINSRPRPDFSGRAKDFPGGGAPDDIGYPVERGAGHLSPH
ncbi:MAG: c-type cytochrome [Gemmatimonadota bacterium]|nr:c-type cytochrome [Gemmatimonadota bacterium]